MPELSNLKGGIVYFGLRCGEVLVHSVAEHHCRGRRKKGPVVPQLMTDRKQKINTGRDQTI